MFRLGLGINLNTPSSRGTQTLFYNPIALFSNGEEGAWYEPSTTTAFRSTTDLTPCGYGDACGFLLDKSQGAGYSGGSFTGLGSELVTNGTFDTDVSGFLSEASTSISWSGGVLEAISTSAGSSYVYQNITTEVGKSYLLECDFNDGGNILAAFNGVNLSGSVLAANTSANSSKSLIFVAQSTSSSVGARPTSAKTWTMDNISVRELPGNHATQSSEPARPILARVPSTGRRNLLERTEEFDDAYWTKLNSTITANATTAPDGQTTAEKLTPDSGTGVNTPVVFTLADQTVETRTLTAYMKAAEYDKGFLRVGGSNDVDTCPIAVYDLSAGTVLSSQGTSVVASISPVGDDGWYRCRLTYKNGPASAGTGQAYAPNIGCASDTYSVNSLVVLTTTDGTSGIYIWGAQLEAASSASAYQKVVDQYDITEAGVTSLEYLAFDGSDDVLVTPSTVDLSASNKLTVISGAEKESDALSVIADNGNSVTPIGTFYHGVGSVVGGGPSWWAASRGAATGKVVQSATSTATFAAPITNVVTAQHDIPGDLTSLRIDGAANGTDAVGDKGAGNFANYNFWVGARAFGGGSLFFDGKIFGLIVRGASSTTQEITNTETYLAAKSGVTL